MIDWLSHTRFQQLSQPLCRRGQLRLVADEFLWPSTPFSAPLSGFHLRLSTFTYPLQEVFSRPSDYYLGSLAAASAVLPASSYLQSPPSAWLCLLYDPKLPKDLCLFHEINGFRGCFALVQDCPQVAPSWNPG
jgi:hypothetical protein